jgi:hypothetical protein
MTDPISVDTERLKGESFRQFYQLIVEALQRYDAGGAENFPLGDDLTETDLEIITPIVNAHPDGQIMLQVLLAATGGDAKKVDLLAQLLEAAEDENSDLANFNTGGGARH